LKIDVSGIRSSFSKAQNDLFFKLAKVLSIKGNIILLKKSPLTFLYQRKGLPHFGAIFPFTKEKGIPPFDKGGLGG
jgi:capsule polysaccharide export protein KpsE/RkpR